MIKFSHFFTLFLLLIFLVTPALAEKKGNTKEDSMLYPVHAQIKEIKNRTLEATVRGHKVIIDQPKAFGADDLGPTPPELLAISYGSCVVATIQLLALQQKLDISDISVTVDGIVDFSKARLVSVMSTEQDFRRLP